MLEVFKDDYEMFHSSFQIENFILIKNGKTTFGIYKQCLRELLSRESSLRSVYAQKLKQDIDYDELMSNLKKAEAEDPQGFDSRRLRISRAEMEYGRKDILRVISETEREYRHFYNAGVLLKNKLGDITPERRLKLEEEHWVEQCRYKMCSDIRFTGVVSIETLSLMDNFPNRIKNDLTRFVNRISNAQGKDERLAFLEKYSRNFEFGKDLDAKLPFEIKKLVENNGA